MPESPYQSEDLPADFWEAQTPSEGEAETSDAELESAPQLEDENFAALQRLFPGRIVGWEDRADTSDAEADSPEAEQAEDAAKNADEPGLFSANDEA